MQMVIWAALIAACVAGGAVVVPKLFRGRTWVQADGTVESCVAASLPVKRKSFVSGVRLSYSYWANNTLYSGNSVEIGVEDEKTEALIAAFPRNATLRVRYDSDNPEQSMIDPADNPKIAELAGVPYASIADGGPSLPFDL